ncbi:branched-chain amino acid transport system II carrier protein [Clostridium mediterraneense]|uniref:branched-chain amino acid transport system II carrier protein n=1 Tax=Clostridium mediterraneense TaxID=1805472 RepID=UPI000831A2BF|nr:branched-chain amino acid transport system II carrier protein [Clostridium mediterraneense]
MNKKTKDYLIIGFALFSMFFGAGNLIFPPFLGQTLGEHYWLGIIGFTITGVGLPLLGLLAATKNHGNFEELSLKVGKNFSKIYSIALFLLIGPMLAIPRTAATTYEISIQPNFEHFNTFIFIVIYFAINLIFVLRPSKIIETIGKYLTPILLFILVILIVKGIINPVSGYSPTDVANPLAKSLIDGYQTMDALASIIFASLIIGAVKSKGYKENQIIKVTVKASIVAIIGLGLVYGGLIFLGSRTGSLANGLSNSTLLLFLSSSILGKIGTITIGVALGLACLTTSIGLLSSGGEFFERISNGKLKYTYNVLAMVVISIGIASVGLDNIISLSASILGIIYPITIVLILLNLFDRFVRSTFVYQLCVYTTLIISILTFIAGYSKPLADILGYLPLYSSGFGWILPFVIAFIIGNFFFRQSERVSISSES